MTPIAPVDSIATATALPVPPVTTPATHRFTDLLVGGIDAVNAKVQNAEATVQAFTLDDSIPVHQVTFALERARLSLELMLQVRSRVVEAYQQFMNMQL